MDAVREQRVVQAIFARTGRDLRSNTTGVSDCAGQWTIRQVFGRLGDLHRHFSMFLLCVHHSITKQRGITNVLGAFGHLQKAVVTDPLSMGRALPPVGGVSFRLGLMVSSGIVFILNATLFMTWKSTEVFCHSTPKYLLTQSPVAISVVTAIVIFMLYLLESDIHPHNSRQSAAGPLPPVLYRGYSLNFFASGYSARRPTAP